MNRPEQTIVLGFLQRVIDDQTKLDAGIASALAEARSLRVSLGSLREEMEELGTKAQLLLAKMGKA